MDKVKQKATRVLRNLSFKSPESNISLVGPEVGSGANQTKVLILKQAVNTTASQQQEEPMVDTINVTKSRFDELETKEAELLVAVQKAADLQSEIEALKAQVTKAAEDKEALELNAFKDRLAPLVAEAELEKVSKSLFSLNKVDAESVEAIIATFVAKKAALENSDLFQDVSHDQEVTPETKQQQVMKSVLSAPYEPI